MNITLKKLSTSKFETADQFFRSADFRSITRDYFSYVYTSALQYLETGDANILNRVVTASRSAAKVRLTAQLISLVSCHSIVAGKYKGKANQKRLKLFRSKGEADIKERMEAIINRTASEKEDKASTFNADMATTRAVNAIASLLAHGQDVKISELMALATEQKDKVKVKSTIKGNGLSAAMPATEPDF